jgi:hypothetical protein
MIESPVFLVGAERSGTTLLRLMISHHPLISFDSESEYLVDAMPSTGLPTRDAFVQNLKEDRGFEYKKRIIRPDLDVVALANDVVAQKAGDRKVAVYGATVHRHFDKLLRIWPNARFIHLVRDGRDVAESTIPMGWSGNMYTGIGRWLEAEELWAKMAEHLPADRHLTLTYEALVTDPVAELTRICRFVGLAYDPAMLSYDESSTYSKPNTSSIAKWKSLSRSKVAPAESRAAAWLIKHGYELSGPVRQPGSAGRLYYKLHDRWGRMRFAQRRLTFSLWLERLIAKRIGGETWRERVRQRERAIINRHLK